MADSTESPSWITALSWLRGLHNSMKLWAVLYRATQDGWIIVESSDNVVHWRREWQTTPVFLLWEPHEQDEKARRYGNGRWATQVGRCPVWCWGRVRAITNSSRKNEVAGPKWKWRSVVDVSGGEISLMLKRTILHRNLECYIYESK